MAAMLRSDRLGMVLGVFSFWGMMPVRPNDFDYRLVDAQAEGDRLDLTVLAYDDAPTTLSVHAPRGLTTTQELLEIRSAQRVTWQSWDCRVKGKTLLIAGGASLDEASRPIRPADPAVQLKRA